MSRLFGMFRVRRNLIRIVSCHTAIGRIVAVGDFRTKEVKMPDKRWEGEKMGKRMAICEFCKNLIEVGDGDFICCECEEPVVVISKFVSTNDYLKCGSRKYRKAGVRKCP